MSMHPNGKHAVHAAHTATLKIECIEKLKACKQALRKSENHAGCLLNGLAIRHEQTC